MDSILSVVIATRNRRDNLRRCLESLTHCNVPAGWMVEILVVDNGGTDSIVELVASMTSAERNIEFRHFSEPRQGKSFAVNCGVAAARGKILAFTDDDATADKEWLTEVINEFSRDPALDLLAGCVQDVRTDRPSRAITRPLEKVMLNGLSSLEGHVLGCNLAIRRVVLEKVKGRDTRLGPGRGLSCEDIDFTHRVLRAGFRGVFSPAPVVYHDPGERDRTREYLRGWGAFYIKFILSGDRQVARQAWWKLHRMWREIRSGIGARTCSILNEIWQMAVGATIMATRTVISMFIYR
jgi:glycosyltransferase involved in cell wall biosynthesis